MKKTPKNRRAAYRPKDLTEYQIDKMIGTMVGALCTLADTKVVRRSVLTFGYADEIWAWIDKLTLEARAAESTMPEASSRKLRPVAPPPVIKPKTRAKAKAKPRAKRLPRKR
jgi:hypothetical protein